MTIKLDQAKQGIRAMTLGETNSNLDQLPKNGGGVEPEPAKLSEETTDPDQLPENGGGVEPEPTKPNEKDENLGEKPETSHEVEAQPPAPIEKDENLDETPKISHEVEAQPPAPIEKDENLDETPKISRKTPASPKKVKKTKKTRGAPRSNVEKNRIYFFIPSQLFDDFVLEAGHRFGFRGTSKLKLFTALWHEYKKTPKTQATKEYDESHYFDEEEEKCRLDFLFPVQFIDEFAREAGRRFGFRKGANSKLFLAIWDEYKKTK
jgi:hypothetical protein